LKDVQVAVAVKVQVQVHDKVNENVALGTGF
jgi:hypothetical protein